MITLIRTFFLIVLYCGAGYLAGFSAIPSHYASLFWPSAGIAISFVYLFGYRMLPGVFVAASVLSVMLSVSIGLSGEDAVVIFGAGVGSSLQAFVGAYLLRRFVGVNTHFYTLNSLAKTYLCLAFVCLVSASVACVLFYVIGRVDADTFLMFWGVWYLGDVLGCLVVTPLLLLCLNFSGISVKRKLSVVLPVMVLLVFVIALFLYMKNRDFALQKQAFHTNVELLERSLKFEFEAKIYRMSALRGFYSASSHVGRDDFTLFSRESFKDQYHTSAFVWAPYVLGNERASFVRAMREEYGADADIIEMSDQGKIVVSPEKRAYMPVQYAEPFDRMEGVLGFDLLSTDIRRDAIERSKLKNEISASEPFHLAHTVEKDVLGFILSAPVFRELEYTGADAPVFLGVVVGAFEFSVAVENAVKSWGEKGLELRLRTMQNGQMSTVYETASGFKSGDFIDGLFYESPYKYADQDWVFGYFINPDFYIENINFLIWNVFVTGLLCACLASMFLIAITGQSASMAAVIDEKTREVSHQHNFLKIIMDHVPDMIFVKDKNFNIVQANQPFFDKFAPNVRGDLVGRSELRFFSEDEREIYRQADQRVFEDGYAELEETVTDYLGVTRTMSTRKLRFHDEEGEPFLLGFARDITDILSVQSKLETILDTTADGIITTCENGKIETYNKACEVIFGYKAEEVIGRNISMLMPKDHTQHYKSYLHDYIMAHDLDVSDQGHDLKAQRKDGTLFPVSFSMAEVELGGRRIFSGVVRDITQQIKAEELAQQVAQIFNNTIVEFYIFDAETMQFLFVNDGAIQNMGYSQDELIGHRPSEFIPEYGEDKFKLYVSQLITGESDCIEFDMRHSRKDNSSYDVIVNLQLIRFDGRPAFIASMLDVTERNKIMEDLKRSNKELESFAYVTSHDLKAPLRHISMSASFFKDKFADKLDEEAHGLLEIMMSGTGRMQSMIESLLAYSRVGRDHDSFTELDLNEVVSDALQNLSESIELSGAEVVFEALPKINGDRFLLIQLFQNLIQNAIKYRKSDAAPRIEINATDIFDGIEVSIADNGIGIDPAYGDKIFQIFQRLHRDNEYDGVGIGLSIAQRIVELHGGRIRLDSDFSGGAKMIFTLSYNHN